MTEFEAVLQECLYALEQGNSNVEECLQRYPKYAQQLEPVLLTSAYLRQGSQARVSDAFKGRVRNQLLRKMDAHPRRQAQFNFLFLRLVGSLAVVLLVLLTAGTVYAQSALPIGPFYSWKLVSENVWRSVSSDPIGVDLAIAERRADELIAVRGDPILSAQTLKDYMGVVERLKSETNAENEARISTVLHAQFQTLNQLDILPDQPSQDVTPLEASSPTSVGTVLPVLETPPLNPTDSPAIVPTVQVPTVQVPSKVIPTTEVLTKIAPTLEVPPAIP
jgi:hypothetical protein